MGRYERWWNGARQEQRYIGPPSELEFHHGFGYDWPVGHKTASGVVISEETAMRHAAVYSCVRIISESMGSLPLRVVRRLENGGVEPQAGHLLDALLYHRPNPRQTPTVFKRFVAHCQEIRGNGWILVVRNEYSGNPVSLIPIMPQRVIYESNRNGREYIEIEQDNGQPIVVDPMDMIHLPHLVTDESGLGKSPIRNHAIELGLATTKATERFYGEGYRQTAVISHPGNLKKGTGESLAKRFEKKYSGVVQKGFGLMVLDEGMQFQQVGLSAEDAALLDSMGATKADIASIFRVPLIKLQELDNAHYNNAEHYDSEYRNEVKLPKAMQWEEEMTFKLLTPAERERGFEVWFDMNAQNRADLKSRSENWASGVEHGYLSPNDILGEMGKPPVEHGDTRYYPGNLVPLGERPQAARPGGGSDGNNGR